MVKKYGLLTFHRPINCGAALQTVATYKYFDAIINGKIELIDYRHRRIEANRRLIGGRWFKQKTFFQNFKSIIKDCLDYGLERRRQIKFDIFINENTQISQPVTDENINLLGPYQGFIVGSDLVWNWELDINLNPVFFLDFITDDNVLKFTYGTSIGSDMIPKEWQEVYKQKINKFDAISVRETSTQKLLQTFCEDRIECVVDPTMLIEQNQWFGLEKKTQCPDKYVLLYILQETENVNKIIRKVVDAFKLPVVYYSKKTIKEYPVGSINAYNIGPDEFLYLVHNAEFIVTNSFHGMVFSLIYDKGFVCIPHTTRGVRMIDCLERIGMSDHCCRIADEVDLATCQKNLSQSGRQKFDVWKLESQEYVRKIINWQERYECERTVKN